MYAENVVNIVLIVSWVKTHETQIEILSANSELKWKNGNNFVYQLNHTDISFVCAYTLALANTVSMWYVLNYLLCRYNKAGSLELAC